MFLLSPSGGCWIVCHIRLTSTSPNYAELISPAQGLQHLSSLRCFARAPEPTRAAWAEMTNTKVELLAFWFEGKPKTAPRIQEKMNDIEHPQLEASVLGIATAWAFALFLALNAATAAANSWYSLPQKTGGHLMGIMHGWLMPNMLYVLNCAK